MYELLQIKNQLRYVSYLLNVFGFDCSQEVPKETNETPMSAIQRKMLKWRKTQLWPFLLVLLNYKWTASSEFVSSSIPSWQNLTAHAQPFRGARDLAFCLKVHLDSLLVWASSEGSGETARMRRLAWTFAARIGYKYQIRLTRSISWCHNLIIMSRLMRLCYFSSSVNSFFKPTCAVIQWS